MHKSKQHSRYLTVNQFSEMHPAFSKSALRHLIFHAKDRFSRNGEITHRNGLIEAKAILHIGRKVLINEQQFFKWAEESCHHNEATS